MEMVIDRYGNAVDIVTRGPDVAQTIYQPWRCLGAVGLGTLRVDQGCHSKRLPRRLTEAKVDEVILNGWNLAKSNAEAKA